MKLLSYTYAPYCSIKAYRHSLNHGECKARWFASKGITNPTKRNHRDYRNAAAICAMKRRYSFIGAVIAGLTIGNHTYHCAICEEWHTSRQSKRENREKHLITSNSRELERS